MCEILLCVKDMADKSDAINRAWQMRRPQAGDVVWIGEDGHPWGSLELGGHKWGEVDVHSDFPADPALKKGDRYYIDQETQTAVPVSRHINGNHSFWRIIKLPNVSVSDALALAL